MRIRLPSGASLLLWALLPALATAQRTEIIRGRVTTDSGVAVAAATVTATRAPDRNFFQTATDSAGRYLLVIPDGTGDYLLHVAAAGRQTVRRRVTRASDAAATDTVYVIDVKLASAVQQLAAVRVQTTKPKPSRSRDPGLEVGGADRVPDDFRGALPPELIGDLAATAATLPGIVPVSGGYSVLGLGPEQNSITVNGMSFGGASLPRDARVATRVSTTTYDPARGWFSGANINVDVLSGSVYSSLTAHTTLDAPPLQATDPIANRLGQRFTNVNGSVGGGGPLTPKDRFFYSYALQGARRQSATTSLLAADADLLRHAGVAFDSAARLLQILNGLGVPVSRALAPSSLTSDNAMLLARFDWSPYDRITLAPSRQLAGLTVIGNWSRTQPLAVSPTATPGHAGERSQGSAHMQGLYSTYFGDDYLSETRSALSLSRQRATPYLALPEGNVLVSSSFADGAGSVSALRFGGNGSMESDVRQWTWETSSEMQLYPPRRTTHRVKLTADSRLDGYAEDVAGNRLGNFAFNSLSDLAAGRAAAYTRTLVAPARSGGAWNGFFSIGDLWRASRSLQLLYGGRIEANAFTLHPAYNSAIDRLFGTRTDRAPSSWHVSPRLGFTWVRAGASNNGAITFNPMGVFNMGPTSYIRGGVGEFRSMLPPTLLSGASIASGLPDGTQALACVGPAVPFPDWKAYATDVSTIPHECAGGSLAAPFTDVAPAVELFDRAYAPPRSWRGNLSYSSQYRRIAYTIDGTYSLNLSQPGSVDLNFRDAPVFTLGTEGRPVFVPPAAIVPSTGTVAPLGARVDQSFGRVVSHRADLRSVSRQATVSVSPDLFGVSHWLVTVAYALSDFRSLESGFDGSTFGSPLVRAWGRAPLDARHQYVVRAGFGRNTTSFTLFGRFQSGLPFTPRVGSDVNGDGLANDRAFVLDPLASDPTVAAATRALLTNSSSRVATCLTRQLGSPAKRASCEGPWTASLNAQLTTSGSALHLSTRFRTIALTFSNSLGGLDQVLHGSAHLRGWGTQPFVDPVLYNVRGFDPSTNRFRYEVNPRFGNTDPSSSTLRAPFRVTLDVGMNLGRDIFLQQVERALKPGRRGYPGPRLTVDDLKRRYSTNLPEPYAAILQETDSLLLTGAQVAAVQAAQTKFAQKRDSLLTSLATYLAGLGDTYDAREALARQEKTIAQGFEIARLDVRATLPSILSPIQLQMLPGYAGVLVRANEPLRGMGRTLRP